MGFEPITTALSTQHSNQLSQDPYLKGLEPSTTALSTQHSIQLSYDPNLVKGLLPPALPARRAQGWGPGLDGLEPTSFNVTS